jgi:hypothetical protein
MKMWAQARERGLDLTVAYVSGDDLMPEIDSLLKSKTIKHLDAENEEIKRVNLAESFIDNPDKPLVCANAYLGSRAIVAALRAGADVVICGRVSDRRRAPDPINRRAEPLSAAPVLGAAWYWHNWNDNEWDKMFACTDPDGGFR